VSRREEEKRKSLGALFRIAEQAKAPILTPQAKAAAPPPPPPPSLPRPAPAKRAPAPPASKAAPSPAAYQEERRRLAQAQERREKLAEERALRERRQRELARNANLDWRGMDNLGVPTGIRRTAFDRVEPNVSQKIEDVLGAPREKEGRAKNREKGRRQSGTR
jgi:hypothetical protein